MGRHGSGRVSPAIKTRTIGFLNKTGICLNVIFNLDRSDCRRWLLALAPRFEAAGHGLTFRVREDARPGDRAISGLLAFESLVFGKGPDATGVRDGWAPLDPAELPTTPGDQTGVVVDLSGSTASGERGGPSPDFYLICDDRPGIGAVARLLVGGHIPFVEIRHPDGTVAASGLPAIEQPDVLRRALDPFLIRIGTLILMALDGQTRSFPQPTYAAGPATTFDPLVFGARAFCSKVANRLFGARFQSDHWRVGVRRVSGPLSVDGDTAIEGFDWLVEDGQRYYADPILWSEGERNWLFIEEYPYASARGIIAYTELDAAGRPLFSPRPIIERSTHLSYPFLFEHSGAIYMTPENAAEGHVPLYRAARFPDLWEEMPPLLPGIGLHDATLFQHEGAWWLVGNEARDGGSSWDCLMIFRSETPLGPFIPHPANPVLVDARIARPGGPVLALDGRLVRPVQSCLGGYGRFTRFVEIEELSMTTFRQRERGRMLAPLGGPITGVHTYSRSARFEAIDALMPRAVHG